MLLWEGDLGVVSKAFLAGSIQNQCPLHSANFASLSLLPGLNLPHSLRLSLDTSH